MKITFHKKIAAYFGYEFTRINKNKYQNQNLHIKALIEHHNIDLVIDVGANMGQFGIELRKSGYQGLIISFEPVKTCYKYLTSIADNNWLVQDYALGDENSLQSINISNKSVFSSILETNDFGKNKFSESISINDRQDIQVKRLDEVLPKIVDNLDKKKIFLKLDTQGYDLKVLKGSIGIMDFVYAMQSEISCKAIYKNTPPYFEALKEISAMGFNITGIFPLSYDDDTMELLEFDCVLTKAK